MNKLYQNFVIGKYDDNTSTNGLDLQPCKIISAKIVPGAFHGLDALHINLVRYETNSEKPLSYGLIGKNVFNEFLNDMNVKKNNLEGLVGKVVEAHLAVNTDNIRGISLQK